ncbi:MAG: energy transducer TonB [Bacteroidales bacterium]|nr:energy transducer TonB [Bacteroidales bacterium]
MEAKKSNKSNLENKRPLFFQVGLVCTLALVLIAFEWESPEKENNILITATTGSEIETLIPITRDITKPKPPELPKIKEIIAVDDNMELEYETEFEDVSVGVLDDIDWVPFEQAEEKTDGKEFFIVVEDMPTFNGGDISAFHKHVQSQVVYPQQALEMGIEGTVHVNFIIDKKGNLTNINLTRKVDPLLDNEVMRILKKSPKWKAGKQRGNPVPVLFSIPVRFELN